MNIYSWIQLIFYIVVLIALAKPLGSFMAKVYQSERTFLDPVLVPVERIIYRLSGINAGEDMNWKTYTMKSCPAGIFMSWTLFLSSLISVSSACCRMGMASEIRLNCFWSSMIVSYVFSTTQKCDKPKIFNGVFSKNCRTPRRIFPKEPNLAMMLSYAPKMIVCSMNLTGKPSNSFDKSRFE